MAIRNPLVLIGGQIQELPSGDSVATGLTIGVAAGNVQQVDQAITATTRAATTTLGTSLYHTLSDTSATITAFNGVAGVRYRCRALGTGIIQHHATDLIITQTGADITTAAGDTFEVYMLTDTTCRVENYVRASGEALVSNFAFSSAAENIAGTVENKAVDPLGIREAFNASGSAPVFACRAWVNFNGVGAIAIRASGNVSSITDNGVGRYTVNFATAMPDGNYSVVGMAYNATGSGTAAIISKAAYSASSISISSTLANNVYDSKYVSVAVFR